MKTCSYDVLTQLITDKKLDKNHIDTYMKLIEHAHICIEIKYKTIKYTNRLTSLFSNEYFTKFLIDNLNDNYKTYDDSYLIHLICLYGNYDAIINILDKKINLDVINNKKKKHQKII